MPIIKPSLHSQPIFYPKDNYTVVKYLDLTKFISLLYKQALFFCRVDKLEDPFEGTTSKVNYDWRINFQERLRDSGLMKISMPDEIIKKSVEEQYEFERQFKALSCVNCWNKKEDESVALWKIYSDMSKGIMIKSSVSRLLKSLENTKEEVLLSEVRYLDYDKDLMLDGNSTYPLIHKQIAYSYEEEIRLIYTRIPENGWTYDWSKEEVNEGLYLSANLHELIDEIILSPFSPKWYFGLIQDIVKKYGLDKIIKKSKLSIV